MTTPTQVAMCRILLMAANPGDTTRLALDVEMREVGEALLRGRFRDRFEIILAPAPRLQDFQHLIDRYKPQIVHFTGHGSESREELMFHDGTDNAAPARVELIAQLLDPCDGVVLNACCSARQAEAIADRGPWAIGTSAQILDSEARSLSRCLYEKLANGCELEDAFRGAAIQVGLEGRPGSETLPQFFPGARRLRPASVYPLTNALIQLWASCARERVPIRTFHKLLLVSTIAPGYFESVFDAAKDGAGGKVVQWLRLQAERHVLSPIGETDTPIDDDPVLKTARDIARTDNCNHVDARCYLVALLSDTRSATMGELRRHFDGAASNGFSRVLSAARSHRPETYALRSAVTTLDLS